MTLHIIFFNLESVILPLKLLCSRAGRAAAVPAGACSSVVEVALEWVLQIRCRSVVGASRVVVRRHGDARILSVVVSKVESGDGKLLGTLSFGLDGVGFQWWPACWKQW
jgi:hypothetical protein